jgi:hypothetical protein
MRTIKWLSRKWPWRLVLALSHSKYLSLEPAIAGLCSVGLSSVTPPLVAVLTALVVPGDVGLNGVEKMFNAVGGEGAVDAVADASCRPRRAGTGRGHPGAQAGPRPRLRGAVIFRGTTAVPEWSMSHCRGAGSRKVQRDLMSSPMPEAVR